MRLNMDCDSAAEIEEADKSDDPEVPAAVVSGWDNAVNLCFYI